MPGHANMSAGHKRRPERLAPFVKVTPKFQLLCVSQNSKARQRVTLAAPDCRWQTPHAAASGTKFSNLFPRKFQNTIRRIGANGVKRTWLALVQPIKAVGMENMIHR